MTATSRGLPLQQRCEREEVGDVPPEEMLACRLGLGTNQNLNRKWALTGNPPHNNNQSHGGFHSVTRGTRSRATRLLTAGRFKRSDPPQPSRRLGSRPGIGW